MNGKSKADRLAMLAKVVSVPKFVKVVRGKALDDQWSVGSTDVIVRSSGDTEDGFEKSQAGKFISIGPISVDKIGPALERVFQQDEVSEAIVQSYAEEGPWGVAFCFSPEDFFVEYSNVREGVTAGRVIPAVAILPGRIDRYRTLQKELKKIFDSFGPCDVEFSGLKNPVFFQIRPITTTPQCNREVEALKMKLQEMDESRWVKNEICEVAGEYGKCSYAFLLKYLERIAIVYRRIFGMNISIPPQPVINISEHWYMAAALDNALRPGIFRLLLGATKIPWLTRRVLEDMEIISDVNQAMDASIILSLSYSMYRGNHVFGAREKCQRFIRDALRCVQWESLGSISRPLGKTIEFDHRKLCWKSFSFRDGKGVVVTNDKMPKNANRFTLKDRAQSIPPGVVVLTDELYPELGNCLENISGIICANGSLTSHIAIRAREINLPLIIQADVNKYL